MRLFLYISPLILLTSCMMDAEKLNYPYPRVAAALKQKFKKYESEFGYIKPQIIEDPGYLYIYQQKCIDFYHTDNITIKVKAMDRKHCKISVKINESNRRWNFDLERKEKANKFLDALKNCLKTGLWLKNPWDKFK